MQVPSELRRKYLDRRVVDIEFLKISLEKNDFGPAAKLGHQVKGNALTFEFPQIAPLGVEIEVAARNRDKESLELLIKKMDAEIKQARLLCP